MRKRTIALSTIIFLTMLVGVVSAAGFPYVFPFGLGLSNLTISGTIFDANGDPLTNVFINDSLEYASNISGSDGAYSLGAYYPNGIYLINFSLSGYEPQIITVTISGIDNSTVDVTLLGKGIYRNVVNYIDTSNSIRYNATPSEGNSIDMTGDAPSSNVSIEIETWDTAMPYYKKFKGTGTGTILLRMSPFLASQSYQVKKDTEILDTYTATPSGWLNITFNGFSTIEIEAVSQTVGGNGHGGVAPSPTPTPMNISDNLTQPLALISQVPSKIVVPFYTAFYGALFFLGAWVASNEQLKREKIYIVSKEVTILIGFLICIVSLVGLGVLDIEPVRIWVRDNLEPVRVGFEQSIKDYSNYAQNLTKKEI